MVDSYMKKFLHSGMYEAIPYLAIERKTTSLLSQISFQNNSYQSTETGSTHNHKGSDDNHTLKHNVHHTVQLQYTRKEKVYADCWGECDLREDRLSRQIEFVAYHSQEWVLKDEESPKMYFSDEAALYQTIKQL